jgi:hypothetical protein
MGELMEFGVEELECCEDLEELVARLIVHVSTLGRTFRALDLVHSARYGSSRGRNSRRSGAQTASAWSSENHPTF